MRNDTVETELFSIGTFVKNKKLIYEEQTAGLFLSVAGSPDQADVVLTIGIIWGKQRGRASIKRSHLMSLFPKPTLLPGWCFTPICSKESLVSESFHTLLICSILIKPWSISPISLICSGRGEY